MAVTRESLNQDIQEKLAKHNQTVSIFDEVESITDFDIKSIHVHRPAIAVARTKGTVVYEVADIYEAGRIVHDYDNNHSIEDVSGIADGCTSIAPVGKHSKTYKDKEPDFVCPSCVIFMQEGVYQRHATHRIDYKIRFYYRDLTIDIKVIEGWPFAVERYYVSDDRGEKGQYRTAQPDLPAEPVYKINWWVGDESSISLSLFYDLPTFDWIMVDYLIEKEDEDNEAGEEHVTTK